uniref:Major facilitator superfamily domain containing 3 n=1 Tax=Eptatretus burgeri TaxID=7764 RepID=A0A8C4R570_EPTBU
MVSENVQQAGGWRLRWLALMYTVQGLPYGLQVGLLPAGLRASGYSLSAVSLSRLLFLPWLCKPLIAPIVERSRRTWLLGSLMSLTAMFIVAAILPGHVGAGVPTSLMHLMPLLLMLNTFAAAHDVVVDGCAVTMLKGNAELGQGNAVQVVFYKLGSLFSGGVLLWALPALTWPGAMLCLAFSCAVASAISFRYPSNGSRVFRGTSKLGGPPVGVLDVIMGADMRWMAAFVLFYKLGEQGSQSTFPLLLLDRGFNTKELGLYISSPATILSLISSSLAAPLLASYRYSPTGCKLASVYYELSGLVSRLNGVGDGRARVLLMTHLLFVEDIMGSLMSVRGTAHTLINHPACETAGRQFIVGSGFKPRRDSFEASVRTSKLSCQFRRVVMALL